MPTPPSPPPAHARPLALPSFISFRLCACNNTRTGCTVLSPMVLCYPAVVVLHFVMLLSCLMITALLWMVVSVVWGLWGGVKRGVGMVQQWGQVQGAMDTLQKDMPMYAPFCTDEAQGKELLTVNHALLALQHWGHLWQRDLISRPLLEDAYRWKFKHKPQSQVCAPGPPSPKALCCGASPRVRSWAMGRSCGGGAHRH